MIWRQNRDISTDYIEELAKEFNTSELLVRILLNRNNDKNFARLVLKDIHEAIIPAEKLVNGTAVAEVIAKHIRLGNIIRIHADYDSDGLNSGFLMGDTIRNLIERVGSHATVEVYYPERKNGYGLSKHFAEETIQMKKELKKDILVITVDNGIAQVEQVKMLVDDNIEVIVTDHHESQDEVPDCLICDPHNHHVEQDDTFAHLCGAGVAFKVCELLQKQFGFHDMYKYVTNVAIATITDVMPLTAENIAFVKYGLELINSAYCPMGVYALKEFLGIDNVNAAHIAWEIGPRLNACGRMNNTAIGGRLLTETDYDTAVDLVNEIELLNDTRKDFTKKAQQAMEKMDFSNDNVALMVLDDLPEGIVGIIAGRATDKFRKPSIVVTEHDGVMHGSARSIPGVDLQILFKTEKDKGNIIGFGGHAEAAGVKFKAEQKEELIKSLNHSISMLDITVSDNSSEEVLLIDECIEVAHLNQETFELINELPYDKKEFAKPTFALVDCKVKDYLPTKSNPDNLWLTVQQGKQTVKLWCQGMTNTYKSAGCPKIIHLAGYVEKNFMSGRPYTFKVIDIISADAS